MVSNLIGAAEFQFQRKVAWWIRMRLFLNTSFIFETLLRGMQELFAIFKLINPISLSLPSVEPEFKEKQKAFFEESQFEEYEDEYAAICFLDGKFNF